MHLRHQPHYSRIFWSLLLLDTVIWYIALRHLAESLR